MAPQDVALKRMHQLVPEDVIGFGEAGGKRQHDAARLMIGEAADAVAEKDRRDRSLREVTVARIENDWLAAIEPMIERNRQPVVPALGHPGRLHRRLAFFGVVVDVEMRRFEYAEVEAIVLNFVAPEVLRAGR